MDSGTIINILLASISAILLAKIFQPVEIPIPYHKKPILIKNYSKKQLIKFNGKDSDSIYMAVSNLVFDVTAGKGFYGPDGVYGNFAGIYLLI